MTVTLKWITPQAESIIAYIARVSNPANQSNPNYEKLIGYLIKNKHWSPFEMANATFEITTSMAIAEQMLRHRSFSFQKFSGRYAPMESIQPVEMRIQAIKNRQSSEDVFNPVIQTIQHERDWDSSYNIYADEAIRKHMEQSMFLYHKLLNANVAREQARMVLPLATSTTLYMNGTIRSWIHYLQLRNDEHAQKEHRLIAQQIEKILRAELPTIFAALDGIKRDEENNRLLLELLHDHSVSDATFLEMLLTTQNNI